MTEKHLARQIDFDTLLEKLEAAKAEKAIYCRGDGTDSGLLIWNYTSKCVYDKMWTPITKIARGLILDMKERRVVATPFPKFFNVSENGDVIPDQPFEVFEKLDGSLIILFFHEGRWKASTRGALGTDQAIWVEKYLTGFDLSALVPGATYLAEVVYPENRIVIRYEESGLILLSAYDADGYEMTADAIYDLAAKIGWRAAKRYSFASTEELFSSAETLSDQEEGYVLRFADGLRLKLKGSAYCRVHAIISRVTPLGIWDAMNADDDLVEIRRLIPEELWWDFDTIEKLINASVNERVSRIMVAHEETKHLSNKELGLSLSSFPADIGKMLFMARKDDRLLMQQPKAKQSLLRAVRPTSNVLEGYTASFALTRVMEDE